MAQITDYEKRIERRLQLWRGKVAAWRGATVGERFGLGRGVHIIDPVGLRASDDVTIEEYGYLHCQSQRGVRFGRETSVGPRFWVSCGRRPDSPGYFELGDFSFIGPNGVMGAGGPIVIGSHVLLGPNVIITAENHAFDDPNLRIDQQGTRHRGVIIEDDCWIAGRVTVLDGVTIGRGSVIGAGSVVTRSIPSYSVAYGVPARVIRSRMCS